MKVTGKNACYFYFIMVLTYRKVFDRMKSDVPACARFCHFQKKET